MLRDFISESRHTNRTYRSLSFAAILWLLSIFHIAFAIPNALKSANIAATEEPEDPASFDFWWKLLISICFILAGGVFAGLTLGLMGLDELHLRVLSTSSDDEKERENAKKVLGLLKKGRHWVLVVLLLGNVIVNESLPVFLDSAIGGGVAAIAISTVMIVIFGIIPQAVCARHGLSIGARCVPFVLCLMYLFSPVAWPIAKLLDRALGAEEGNTYKKAELRTFLQFHRQGEEPLRNDEISILNGVLELNTKSVVSIMTPIKDVVSLSSDNILDYDEVKRLLSSGYSRFPVHEPGKPLSFIGLLLIKNLSAYDPSKKQPVSHFPLSILAEADPSINCFQALDYFQTGRAHLLLISKTPGQQGGALGVITLEDVIEEIISEEIVDETDRYEDNRTKRQARRKTNTAVMQGIVEHTLRRNTAASIADNEQTPLFAAKDPANARNTGENDTSYGSIVGSPNQ